MEPSFWHNRWQTENIHGFHLPAANPRLVKHWPALGLAKGTRVLVPLCGKSLDLPWLAAQGHKVAGVELSPLAVEQFFKEMGVTPTVRQAGSIQVFQTPDLEIYAGDFFELSPQLLGPVDAVYDRAALVALPAPMRQRYTAHLGVLAPGAPQLLVTYVYDQTLTDGPPFSVSGDEVQEHYRARYRVERLLSEAVEGGLRGKTPAIEEVWALRP